MKPKMAEGYPHKYSLRYATAVVIMGHPEDVAADVAETFINRLGAG
jgi:hypothetical protein